MSPEVNTQPTTRSPNDADLLTRIGIAITLRQRAALRKIQVIVDRGCVTLRGQLPSFFDKQLAIETSRRVAGVVQVFDELKVVEIEKAVELPADDEHITANAAQEANRYPSIEFPKQRATIPSIVATVTFIRTASVFLLCVSSLFAGCNQTDRLKLYPVEGQVTYNGKPLANALVVFHPKDTSNPKLIAARGQTDKSGVFKVSTYVSHDGAPVGSYAVTVECFPLVNKGNGGFEPGPNALPPRLASPQTTDIVVEVAAIPNTLAPLEVRR